MDPKIRKKKDFPAYGLVAWRLPKRVFKKKYPHLPDAKKLLDSVNGRLRDRLRY